MDTGVTLTLRDIADLAGVQRAVVSMWRRRPVVRGVRMPFPDPVPAAGTVERFRRGEIVEWLARTGRGNNREHHLDAPSLAVPDGVALEDLVTLLCLYAHADTDLADLTADQCLILARRHDPDDRFLLSEVRQAAARPGALCFIDELVEATYGLPEALARLESGRAGRVLGRRDLSDAAVDLLRTVVRAAALHLAEESVPVAVDGVEPRLALALGAACAGLILTADDPAGRALRRRAVIHDLDLAEPGRGPALRVLSVIGQDSEAALDRVDELVLGLAPGDVGVTIGPASLLCERLRGDTERLRATILRPGRLAAAVRLPRTLWREAHRQALGLWICVGGRESARPFVADLIGHQPAEVSATDLAADIVGALMGGDAPVGGPRAYRYLRSADLPVILTGAPVVPPGARPPRFGSTSGDHLERVQAAVAVTAMTLPAFDVLVTAAPATILLRQRSLGELRDAGMVQMRRGSRIDVSQAPADGTVPVLTGDGATDGARLDPFRAVQRYPRAQRTEPGDIVFLERPRPAARVDRHGGSLVASPSRILRLDPRVGLGPHTVAAIINHGSHGVDWQTWSLPILDPEDSQALEEALADATDYDEALSRRRQALHELISTLIDGVAASALTVASDTSTPEGR